MIRMFVVTVYAVKVKDDRMNSGVKDVFDWSGIKVKIITIYEDILNPNSRSSSLTV